MSKKHRKNSKWLEYVFYGIVILLVILLIAKAFVPNETAIDSTSLVITEDGHVHTADGTHLGTYDEIFGTITEAGIADEAAVPADPAAGTTEIAE